MSDIFTYRDDKEGKVGIGKLPLELQYKLKEIAKEYNSIIPDKNASTHHIWFDDMPQNIKSNVEIIQNHNFWKKLCDNTNKCIIENVNDMDEIYYSNPKNNYNKINLYGATSNYDVHKDCIFNFNGIKFYRVLIGLSNNNSNMITYFNNLKTGHKINSGDYIVFDFDKSTHQVIKDTEKKTPRILLKLHYIVCENCKYNENYVKFIKQIYINYEYITRYIMKNGTDPKTFTGFFFGLMATIFYQQNIEYILFLLIFIIIVCIRFIMKIKFFYKNMSIFVGYTFSILIIMYFILVLTFWVQYKLYI